MVLGKFGYRIYLGFLFAVLQFTPNDILLWCDTCSKYGGGSLITFDEMPTKAGLREINGKGRRFAEFRFFVRRIDGEECFFRDFDSAGIDFSSPRLDIFYFK